MRNQFHISILTADIQLQLQIKRPETKSIFVNKVRFNSGAYVQIPLVRHRILLRCI